MLKEEKLKREEEDKMKTAATISLKGEASMVEKEEEDIAAQRMLEEEKLKKSRRIRRR